MAFREEPNSNFPRNREKPMLKPILIAALLAAPLCTSAQEESAKTPQHEKMAACNKEAADKALKGDDRKKFMSQCLSSGKSDTKLTQQDKKACSKEASDKSLKGDDRKKFMSQCLKGAAKT
jgi:hypothetical protein